MAVGGVYLPPVIAELVANAGEFFSKIEEAKAILADFAKSETDARLGANYKDLNASLATAKSELLDFSKSVYDARLGADAKPFWGEIAALRAEMAAMSPLDINVDANVAGALAKIEALRGVLALSQVDQLAGLGAAGGGKKGGEGGAGGIGAIIGGLLFGGGNKIGPIPAASLGSLGSMAGLGIEHIVMTVVGLIGSAIGAVIGGSLLALGSIGQVGVGGGADALVMKSTIADTTELAKKLQNLELAQLQYGKSSKEAAAAEKLLNVQMEMLGNTAGVQAELGLAKAALALNHYWDIQTSQARVNAVALLTDLLGVARTYIPLIAQAAAENFGLLRQNLQPLFAWLKGPEAIGIFQQLESRFKDTLPFAMRAFTQGLELVLKVMGFMSNYTGGFMKMLDRLFTYWNSATGFARLEIIMLHMKVLWEDWTRLIGIAARDLGLMFQRTVGLGDAIVLKITLMLQKLHEWEQSTQGQAAMHNIFEAHKQQALELLALIPPLVETIGRIYLTLAPTLTRVATVLASLVLDVVDFLTHLGGGVGTIMTWVIGFLLLEAKVKLVTNAFRLMGAIVAIVQGVTTAIWALSAGLTAQEVAAAGSAGAIERVGIATFVLTVKQWALAAATTAAGIATGELDIAELLNPVGLVAAAVVALVVGLYLLVANFREVYRWLQVNWQWFSLILSPISIGVNLILSFAGSLKLLIDIASKLPIVGGAFKALSAGVDSAMASMNKSVYSAGSSMQNSLNGAVKGMQTSVTGGFKSMLGTGTTDTNQLRTNVLANANAMNAQGSAQFAALTNNVTTDAGLMNTRTQTSTRAMKDNLISEFNQMFGAGSGAAQRLSNAVSTSYASMKDKGISDADVMRYQMIDQINQLYGAGTAKAQAMIDKINMEFTMMGPMGKAAGYALAHGITDGIYGGMNAAINAAFTLGKQAADAVNSGARASSPSKATYETGQNVALGLALGIRDKAYLAIGAMFDLGKAVTNPSLIGARSLAPGAIARGSGAITMSVTNNIDISVPAGSNSQQVGSEVKEAIEKAMTSVVKMLGQGAYRYAPS